MDNESYHDIRKGSYLGDGGGDVLTGISGDFLTNPICPKIMIMVIIYPPSSYGLALLINTSEFPQS